MRVLAVGSMYPPHAIGGYEVKWRSAVAALRAAGHDVRVLASDHRDPDVTAPDEPDVHRDLPWFWRDHAFPRLGPRALVALERRAHAVLRRHLAAHRPDVVAWWSMGGMPLSLVEEVRRDGPPAIAVVGDLWLRYGPKVDPWARTWARRSAVPAAPVAERVLGLPTRLRLGDAAEWWFNSAWTRDRSREGGLPLPRAHVAHPGVDPHRFAARPAAPWGWRLLCVGRVEETKGLRHAIGALPALPAEATLRIVGGGDRAHRAELEALAARLGVAGRVAFGRVAHEELPEVYAAADALVFPVTWEEPWGLVPLEAMAVGRPVVGTATGGAAEYLRDGDNHLRVPPGDPRALAAALRRLAGDAGLRERLVGAGLATAARFTDTAFNARIVAAHERLAGAGPR